MNPESLIQQSIQTKEVKTSIPMKDESHDYKIGLRSFPMLLNNRHQEINGDKMNRHRVNWPMFARSERK
jgi:hypothetical protein